MTVTGGHMTKKTEGDEQTTGTNQSPYELI
jgi:hypothetical protein